MNGCTYTSFLELLIWENSKKGLSQKENEAAPKKTMAGTMKSVGQRRIIMV